VGRQSAAVPPPPGGSRRPLCRRFLLGIGIAGGLDLLGLLQAKLQLFFRQALGTAPKAIPLQFLDDLAQPLAFRPLGQQHRLEQVWVVGEGCGGAPHTASESCRQSARDGFYRRS
jgi:hypothetical protein